MTIIKPLNMPTVAQDQSVPAMFYRWRSSRLGLPDPTTNPPNQNNIPVNDSQIIFVPYGTNYAPFSIALSFISDVLVELTNTDASMLVGDDLINLPLWTPFTVPSLLFAVTIPCTGVRITNGGMAALYADVMFG